MVNLEKDIGDYIAGFTNENEVYTAGRRILSLYKHFVVLKKEPTATGALCTAIDSLENEVKDYVDALSKRGLKPAQLPESVRELSYEWGIFATDYFVRLEFSLTIWCTVILGSDLHEPEI